MQQRGKTKKGRGYELKELEDAIQEKGKSDSQEDGDKCTSGTENNEKEKKERGEWKRANPHCP